MPYVPPEFRLKKTSLKANPKILNDFNASTASYICLSLSVSIKVQAQHKT